VVKFHPDKTQDLGDDFRQQARNRFLAIQAAYEQIKLERNIK
jgi:DnaJ like chaperone protein